MTVIPERLALLDTLDLKAGSHSAGAGEFCFNEMAAYLAGEKHSDFPACVSPVLRGYTMRLNDRWNDEQRQSLKPYVARCIGTSSDGKDEIRRRIATRALCTDLLEPWLRLAGMDERADSLAALVDATPSEIRSTLWSIREEAWKSRQASYATLRTKVREELVKQGNAAAVAAAAAAAVAVAAAVADADADAVAVAAGGDYWSQYNAAYSAVRQYFRDNPLPVSERIHELGAQQEPLALVLLDRLIDADEVSA